MERWAAKILALFGTFFLPLICTVLPYKVSGCIAKRGEAGKTILSCLMCFGGGIFFGTYLLHMGPEVRKILDDSLMKPYNITYPVPDLIVGIGFFIVLFAEKVVLRWNKGRMERKRERMCMKEKQPNEAPLVVKVDTTDTPVLCKGLRNGSGEMCEECFTGLPCSGTDEEEMIHSAADDHGVVRLVTSSVADIEDIAVNTDDGTCKFRSVCPFDGTGDCCTDASKMKTALTEKEKHIIVSAKVEEMKLNVVESDGDSHGGHHGHHATRSIILILALSLHRIFEGMSIGLQKSTQDVAHLFIAVMCHETVIGFSLGLQFVKSSFSLNRLLLTSFVCSVIMPFGVMLGTIMTESGHTGNNLDIANGVLQAIAMGTFIYVTFFEILQEEVDPSDTSIIKIVFISIGFMMMALLDLIPEEQYTNVPLNAAALNASENFVHNNSTALFSV